MKTWIDNLDNPLVLVGFVVVVLAGVISLFIRRAKASQSQKIEGDNNTSIAAGGNVSFNKEPQKKK